MILKLTSWAPTACQSQLLDQFLDRSPGRCLEKGHFAGTGELVVAVPVLCFLGLVGGPLALGQAVTEWGQWSDHLQAPDGQERAPHQVPHLPHLNQY